MDDFVAQAQTTIAAPASEVWEAITSPELVRKYMSGTEVETTWEAGSPIVYRGEWEGKRYEDKGTILDIEPPHRIRLCFFSLVSEEEDAPVTYNTLTYQLDDDGDRSRLTVTQENNATKAAAEESERNWNMILNALRELMENRASGETPAPGGTS